MKKYNSIFKERNRLKESNQKWDEFTDLMRTFRHLKFDISTSGDFYTNFRKADVVDLKGGEVVFSKGSDANFVIQLENFSHFDETLGEVIVYSKKNLVVKISWN